MWTEKEFKTHAAMVAWVSRNEYRYQCAQVFINNAYCVSYRQLRVIG